MKTIIFRADAYPSIGNGDLSSLIFLSEYFLLKDWRVLFVTKDYLPAQQLIQSYGKQNSTIFLDKLLDINSEVEKLNEIIIEYEASVIFYSITDKDLLNYKNITDNIFQACICLNDKIDPNMKLIVNWDPYVISKFDKTKFDKTKFLFGSEYIVIPSNFNKDTINSRTYKDFNKLLITLGGADELDFTNKLVNNLAQLDISSTLDITIIVGSGYKFKDILQENLSKSGLKYTIKSNIHNMFEEYINTDFAIGAGGLTAYELLATKTPSALIATYQHQVYRCEEFKKQGFIRYLGYRDINQEELDDFLNNPYISEKSFEYKTEDIVNILENILVEG
jgi:spore coat polysaccharide biosynthesis predicted glycosyltransferase SpsG